MYLSIAGYLCPFCKRYHREGEPEFKAHYPTEREIEILEGGSDGSDYSEGQAERGMRPAQGYAQPLR